MNRAVFLDRDGVINRKAPEGEYITRWEAMQILPGAATAIRLLNQAGFRVIVATNQRCVARGLISAAELELLHRRMRESLAAAGATIDAIFCCPHDLEPACSCRKPSPGLLLEAARAHGLSLASSWMIGDSDSDVAAGKSAGCKTVRLLDGDESSQSAPDIIATNLFDAVLEILRSDGNAARGHEAGLAQSRP